jgi:hypothetical protein
VERLGTRAVFQRSHQLYWAGTTELYQSAESGATEIYVRPYPALDRAWQVSVGGGAQARWHASGKELFYRSGSKMVAVTADIAGAEPRLRPPVVLFDAGCRRVAAVIGILRRALSAGDNNRARLVTLSAATRSRVARRVGPVRVVSQPVICGSAPPRRPA